jgi:hypothetical protein
MARVVVDAFARRVVESEPDSVAAEWFSALLAKVDDQAPRGPTDLLASALEVVSR